MPDDSNKHYLNWQTADRARFPGPHLMLALVAVFALTISMGFWAVRLIQEIDVNTRRVAEFVDISGDILRYDEVLTMSARMYAATGNLHWRNRYEKYETLLSESLDRASDFTAASTGLASTDEANDRLVALEKHSFELTDSGELKEAYALLMSKEYNDYKAKYTTGMKSFLISINSNIDPHTLKHYRDAYLILSIGFCLLVIIFVYWIFIFKMLYNWRNITNNATKERHEAYVELHKKAQELRDHRDHLEEMVDAATGTLKVRAAELQEALSKEKQLNELQRQFVSMASHEFRTPLAVIDGSVQRLIRRKDSMTPEDLVRRSNKIRAAVRAITTLMESTLSAARMDAGEIEINVAECDLPGIVLETCVRQLEFNEDHKIVCNLEGLPECIAGDSTLLDQVLTNLLSNAVKYSPDGPDIMVRGWRDDDDAVVSIQDRGLGIDEDELPQLFSRFFRASTSTGIPGTGIGLSLVKALVELHGGSIEVESKKGEGSTFTVRLPVAGPPAAKPEQANTCAA